MKEIDDIPQNKTENFPEGISEHSYDTAAELSAFLDGLYMAQDFDVEASPIFRRGGKYVVRVKIGDFAS